MGQPEIQAVFKNTVPQSRADTSLSKYSCWPRLFQTTVWSYTIRRT